MPNQSGTAEVTFCLCKQQRQKVFYYSFTYVYTLARSAIYIKQTTMIDRGGI